MNCTKVASNKAYHSFLLPVFVICTQRVINKPFRSDIYQSKNNTFVLNNGLQMMFNNCEIEIHVFLNLINIASIRIDKHAFSHVASAIGLRNGVSNCSIGAARVLSLVLVFWIVWISNGILKITSLKSFRLYLQNENTQFFSLFFQSQLRNISTISQIYRSLASIKCPFSHPPEQQKLSFNQSFTHERTT